MKNKYFVITEFLDIETAEEAREYFGSHPFAETSYLVRGCLMRANDPDFKSQLTKWEEEDDQSR